MNRQPTPKDNTVPALLHMLPSTHTFTQAPKLLKVVLPGYSKQHVRYPLTDINNDIGKMHQSNYNTSEESIPKLIDLRQALKIKTMNQSSLNTVKVPKLLHLPYITNKFNETDTLHSSSTVKHKSSSSNREIKLINLKNTTSNNALRYQTKDNTSIQNAAYHPKSNIDHNQLYLSNHDNQPNRKTFQTIKLKKEKAFKNSLEEELYFNDIISNNENIPPKLLVSPRREKANTLSKKTIITSNQLNSVHVSNQENVPLKLLESPKREKLKRAEVNAPVAPELIDIRPSSSKMDEEVKMIRVEPTAKKRNEKTKHVRKVIDERRFSSESDTFVEEDFIRKKKRNSDREEELYNVIYDLMRERKMNKQKRRKRIKLFDIIDNIPLTSESDISPIIESRRRQKVIEKSLFNEAKPDKIHIESNVSSIYHQEIPGPPTSFQPDKFSGSSQISKTYSQKVDNSKDALSLEQYRPKLSKYLNPANKENDPLSWVNIIKASTMETKDTQTENLTKTKSHTIEVQTEMQEMVEIPRSQTFFAEPKKKVNETKEFCNLVRQEIIDKLEFKVPLDNKSCQTITNAETQTDKDNSTKEFNVIQAEDAKPTVPPDIFTEIKFTSDVNNVAAKHYIDVVDVLATVTKDTNSNHGNNNELENLLDINIQPNDEMQKQPSIPANEFFQNNKAFSPNEDGNGNNMESFSNPTKTYKVGDFKRGKEKEDFPQRSTNLSNKPKDVLSDNIREFSHGLDAIEEIQVNIERELKHSKFLFNTIETLQHGFMEPNNDSEEEFSSDKYSVHKYKPAQSTDHYKNVTTTEHTKPVLDDIIEIDDKLQNDIAETKFHTSNGDLRESNVTMGTIKEEEIFSDTEFNDFGQHNLFESSYTDQSYEKENLNNFNDVKSVEGSMKSQIGSRYNKYNNDVSLVESRGRSQTSSRYNENQKLEEYEASNIANIIDQGSTFQTEISAAQKLKDELFKDEIRKRIRPPVKDPVDLLNEEKRNKLLKWMKVKQQNRRSKYQNELEEKRNKEFKPFITKNTVTMKEIDQNTTIIEDAKKILLQENNKERLTAAEKIATTIIKNKTNSIKESNVNKPKTKRHYFNERSKQPISIPVKETRTSRIRKNALLNEVLRNKNLSKQKTEQNKKKKTNKKIRTNNKKSHPFLNTGKFNFNTNSKNNHGYTDSKLDHSLNKSQRVHANEFVTQDTYEKFQTRSVSLLRDSLLRHQDTRDSTRGSMTSYQEDDRNYNPVNPSTTYRKPRDNNPIHSIESDASNVRQILKGYGMDFDDNLFQRKSDTSRLLEEVDMMLEQTSPAHSSDINSPVNNDNSIDWNEIDNILGE